MRAVRYDEFGPPGVLRVVDVPMPRPRAGEVLVRVRAAGVGGGEMPIRAGKLRRVLRHRPPAGVGNEFTGHVAGTGQAVWGVTPHLTFGSTAEYVAVPERLIAPAPASADLLEAAALPSSGTTVLTALTRVRLRAGQRLLVRGARGGLGAVAVQLGEALGAEVTPLVRGAVLDGPGPYDVVLDAAGTNLAAMRRLAGRHGRVLALALDPERPVAGFAAAVLAPRVVTFSNDPGTAELAELARRVDAGEIRPVVDSVYPMDQIVAAHRRVEAGGVRGKVVIDVSGATA